MKDILESFNHFVDDWKGEQDHNSRFSSKKENARKFIPGRLLNLSDEFREKYQNLTCKLMILI